MIKETKETTQDSIKPKYSKLKKTTSKDSLDYKKGFDDAINGKNRLFPNKSRLGGYTEAKERGLRKNKK